MTFLVSIDKFAGPLDLMLHLIREKELDLFELDMDVLVDQYIEFLKTMDQFHLEVAGEYLAELAGLLEYKSKALLPNNKDKYTDEEEDPKEKLVRRLIEYQRFKDISSLLNDRFDERNKQLSKSLSFEFDNIIQDNDISELKGNPYDLMKAMNRCLRHLALTQPLQTRNATTEMTVEQAVDIIRVNFGHYQEGFTLFELIEKCYDLNEAIISFLAVLELIKIEQLVYHVNDSDDIWLKWSNNYA